MTEQPKGKSMRDIIISIYRRSQKNENEIADLKLDLNNALRKIDDCENRLVKIQKDLAK